MRDLGGVPPSLTILAPGPGGPPGVRRRTTVAGPRVALVTMPFGSMLRPSIQLGLLKSLAADSGFAADTFHLNLDFARLVGAQFYEDLSDFGRSFLGDWLFSPAAFGAEAPDLDGRFVAPGNSVVEQFLEKAGCTRDRLLEIRDSIVPSYLDGLLADIPWGDYQVVGFSSTFEQNVASLALASRLKRAHPGLVVV